MNLTDAVKAAHGLSPKGQAALKQAIADTYGQQEKVVKPVSPVDFAKQEAARKHAADLEVTRAETEAKLVNEIMATLSMGDVREGRDGALRAISEVIGVADVKPVEVAPPIQPSVRPIPAVGDKISIKGHPGVISEVIGGQATRFKMDHGPEINTETEQVTFTYLDPVKAGQDKASGGK